MGTRTSREMKINWILINLNNLKKSNVSIDKAEFVAKFALDMMSTRRTGYDILKTLELAGRIKEEIWK